MNIDFESLLQALDVWTAAIWRASWQSGVAALVVAGLCRFVPSIPARFQCWLWRLVMLKFAISFCWSAPIEIPVLPHAEPIATVASSMPTPIDQVARDVAPGIAASASFGPSSAAPASSRIPWRLIMFLIWAAVVAAQMGRIWASCRNARLLRTRCRPSADPRLIEPCSRFSAMLGLASPPLMLETEGDGSPLLVGVLRPAIVLPTTTLARLDASERSLVLGHELAHISRRDLFCSLVAAMIRALFFFHPAAWFSERRLALSQEIAADQLAISLQNQSPTHYARLLVTIVGKLGSREATLALSMGAAGEVGSLHRRLSAMRYVRQMTPRSALAYGLVIVIIGVVGLVPWSLVAAPHAVAQTINSNANDIAPSELGEQSSAAPKLGQPPAVAAAKTVDFIGSKSKSHRGRFVSMTGRALILETNDRELIAMTIPADALATVWNDAAVKYERTPIDAALSQLKSGAPVIVSVVDRGRLMVRIGARKGKTTGTFVSYNDGRLQIVGTNLGARYTKIYGSDVRFGKFRDDVPAFETNDAGEDRLIGMANEVLKRIKPGTHITVHGEGDDNTTLVRIGGAKT